MRPSLVPGSLLPACYLGEECLLLVQPAEAEEQAVPAAAAGKGCLPGLPAGVSHCCVPALHGMAAPAAAW